MDAPVNPRQEAEDRLDGGYEVRVLEPSPPALESNLDDPAARGHVPAGRKLVSPTSDGDLTWDELANEDSALAEWCAERWLGAWKPLPAIPAELVETRLALHRLAEEVVAPARRIATGGEISLRYARGGFGTPFYGSDQQVRIEGTELVVIDGDEGRRQGLASLKGAAEFVGTIDAADLDDAPLGLNDGAASFFGDWFGFATLAIAELRARAGAELEPSLINLWPEHFDVAAELGSEKAGGRAGYGGSPGDEAHDAPYLYVGPWGETPEGELWTATGFSGAELTYAELLASDDQVSLAVEFFEARLQALTGS